MSDHGHGHDNHAQHNSSGAKTAYRRGVNIFIALTILTIIEFLIAGVSSSAVWMFAIGIGKASIIVSYFMNIGRLWNDGGH